MTINKNNFFYKNRMEIDRISRTQDVDAGVATSIFANNHKGEYTKEEINEWMDIMSAYHRHKTLTLADLFM